MKIRAIATVLGVLGVVLLLMALALRLWGGHPWVFSVYSEIDTNSGDVRKQTVLLGIRVRKRIDMSLFSREVRRLHIRTPEARVWKPIGCGTLDGFTVDPYGLALGDCDFLVQILDVMGLPDQDRAVYLEKALSNLREGKLTATDELIWTLDQQLRARYGMPPTPKPTGDRFKRLL